MMVPSVSVVRVPPLAKPAHVSAASCKAPPVKVMPLANVEVAVVVETSRASVDNPMKVEEAVVKRVKDKYVGFICFAVVRSAC